MEKENIVLLENVMRIMHKTFLFMSKPRTFGTKYKLYTSEIHVINVIGRNPGIKITEVAKILGITKGAIPKIIKKLVDKNLACRYQRPDNKKEIYLELTFEGELAFKEHEDFHKRINQAVIQNFRRLGKKEKDFIEALILEIETSLDKIAEEE